MKKIYKNIFCITEKSFFSKIKPPANIYIVNGEKGIIFDSGYGFFKDIKLFQKEFQQFKKNTNIYISYIIPSHSHGDHFSGLNKIKKITGGKICLTPKIASTIISKKAFIYCYKNSKNSPVTPLIKEKEKTLVSRLWDLGFSSLFGLNFVKSHDKTIFYNDIIEDGKNRWRVLYTPGHCRDHISLYNQKDGVLLGGDNVLNHIITWLGPPESDLEIYCSTLKQILNLENLKIILPAHGSPVLDPQKRIREILDHRIKKTESVIKIISESNNHIPFNELKSKLYPNRSVWIKSMADGWILSTLEFLIRNRIVKLNADKTISKGNNIKKYRDIIQKLSY